jgi:isoleucyl-tRNA synthetase
VVDTEKLYDKGLLYESVSIQPYSPGAGTGLSSHELNQPGTYKRCKRYFCSCNVQRVKNEKSQFLFDTPDNQLSPEIFF